MSYIEKFWRPATDKDVVDVMADKEVDARFRDGATERWIEGLLGGWAKGDRYHWLDESGSSWTFCQVYAPPQWWLDKPEPGEGYRLLGKFPDEALQAGDEARLESGLWVRSDSADTGKPQQINAWYRRRIEQPKPVFKVGDWVKIAKPSPGVANTRLSWTSPMDEYDGRITQISKFRCDYPQQVLVTDTTQWHFHVNWLTPAEPPKPEPKHYSLQVGDTVDVPSGHRITVTEHGVEVT